MKTKETETKKETAMEIKVGELVVNFSTLAMVQAIDPVRGILLREFSIARFGCVGGRWFADPAKCIRADGVNGGGR